MFNSSRISNPNCTELITAIQSVVGSEPVNLHEPSFEGKESDYLQDCVNSGYVSTIGEYVNRFEHLLAEYTGAKHAIAVVNGTSALHIALILSGVKPGDEVLVPALTFVATANAVRYCNAIPHFVDSNEKNLGVDVDALRLYLSKNTISRQGLCINKNTGRVIRAVVPMHTFGHPVDMIEMVDTAAEFGIEVVEDAAEALGTLYHGKHAGTFGRLGIFSFNGNKIITTGGGGAIVTNDSYLASRARHLTTTAKISHGWEFVHDEIGYNYRLPNLNAALGCAQIETIEEKVLRKRRLHESYKIAFDQVKGVSIFDEPSHARSNYWLNALITSEKTQSKIIEETNKIGIKTRPPWTLLSELKIFSNSPRMEIRTSRKLANSIVNLPSSSWLSEISGR